MSDKRKRKHLEFIQGVINRLSMNFFFLKGCSLATVLVFLAIAESRPLLLLLGILPVLAFWVLDGFFLWQEKLYRRFHDAVRQKADKEIDFNLSLGIVLFPVTARPRSVAQQSRRRIQSLRPVRPPRERTSARSAPNRPISDTIGFAACTRAQPQVSSLMSVQGTWVS